MKKQIIVECAFIFALGVFIALTCLTFIYLDDRRTMLDYVYSVINDSQILEGSIYQDEVFTKSAIKGLNREISLSIVHGVIYIVGCIACCAGALLNLTNLLRRDEK